MYKTIYRIEDKEGIGPFNSYNDFDLSYHSHDSKHYQISNGIFKNLPLDFDWSLRNKLGDNALTGVLLPCQLFFWFGNDFDIIIKHFIVYKIKVKTYYEGKSGHQIIFDVNDVVSKKKLIKAKKLKFYAITNKYRKFPVTAITIKNDGNSSNQGKGSLRNEHSPMLSTFG